MTRHGGDIEVESEVGVGTEFRIVLESVEGELEPRERDDSSSEATVACRILVMDDDDMVREVMVGMLEALGHVVVQSRHGQECVDAFQSANAANEPFDLVILDLTIVGGHDGVWAIERLRDLDPHVRALVSTGYNNAPVVAAPASHGFVGSVSKPTTLDELQTSIQAALSV